MRKPNNHKAFLGGGGACNPLIETVSGLFGKLTITGCGFAKKGTKILWHWGTKSNYGSKKECHSELVSESHREQMLKQVQHDNLCVIARSETTKQSLLRGSKILRHYGTRVNLPLPTGEVDFVSERSEFTKSGEGTIFKMLNRAKKKCAFTLSEVLIVLVVLGVVAAMTIPSLIQDYREKALITALKKNYSIFEQAVEMAQVDNGFMTGWDIGTANTAEGAMKLYNILKPYLRIEKECGTEARKGCFADSYEALFNTNAMYPDRSNTSAKGVLASGASFAVRSNGTGCAVSKVCGYISVDVNGKAGPNKFGVDYFEFIIFNWLNNIGVTPAGRGQSTGCTYGDTVSYNGQCCTWWVLKHENMDYLRKAGCYVSSCK